MEEERTYLMRLDHIAYRVRDRVAAVKFFCEAFGYKVQDEFEIKLEDGSTAKCNSLEPPEKTDPRLEFTINAPIDVLQVGKEHRSPPSINDYEYINATYHLAPEFFVSDGPPGSLIDNWVNTWGRGIGGIHHMAYQVENVQAIMEEWKAKGWLFLTEEPLHCENLTQVFSQPNPITGIIYEFIERKGQRGFCKDNVARLMNITKDLNK
jgi:4-hydroxyphenylpyruvate dioxygenase-like putative hemolysin